MKIALSIICSTVGTELKLPDVEIRFTRRDYENLQSKVQVLVPLLNCDKIAPSLAFAHCGMFSDAEDAAKMSADYYEKVKAEQVARKTAGFAPPLFLRASPRRSSARIK